MPLARDLLVQALTRPETVVDLNPIEWDSLIRQARRAALLARIQALLEKHCIVDRVPPRVVAHLDSARMVAENEQRILKWEVNRICRALGGLDVPVILLKGAAYVMLDLPVARGRLSSDVDILVPRKKLNEVEKALLAHGWEHVKLEDYDQYFYRNWSHELPPLRHRVRGTVVDVHHTILPPTGRLHPDPEKLIAASMPLDGSRLRVLAPADMVLHSAAHAFQDGDFQRVMRDLVDLDDLLRNFSPDSRFWEDLVTRAEELDLARPLYYALRYAHLVLKTPVPDLVLVASRRWHPPWPVTGIMDWLVSRAVAATSPVSNRSVERPALWILYMRSHWLRMPPHLLLPHLLRKTLVRSRVPKAKT
jgi:hypothetical protein